MDCGRAGWTDDFHFSPFATQRNEIGRIRVGFDGNPGICGRETQITCDPGWRSDRLLPCGEVDPKTKNAGGHERLTASGSFAHDGDRTGLDGDKHLDERRHRTRAFTDKPWRIVNTKGLHRDFEKTGNESCAGSGLRLVQDGSQRGACCSFAKPKMRYTKRNGANLRGWEPDDSWHRVAAETLTEWENWNAMVPLLMEAAMAQKIGNQRGASDRNRTQNTSVEKEENRAAPRAIRVEQALSSNLKKEESAEARETPDQDQGECRDGESHQENAKQAFQLELDSRTRKPQLCSHKLLRRLLLDSGRPRRYYPIRETSLDRALEKLESGLCRRNVDLNEEPGECPKENEKTGKVHRIKSQRML